MVYEIKYRKEEEMKDSEIEWLGKIPAEWEVTRIKHKAKINGRIGFRGYTVDDIVGQCEGAITLSPSNIQNQKLILENNTYISWSKFHQSPEIKIYNDDVLLVKTASIGKVAYVENLSESATINPQFVVFKNIKLNTKLFYYYMISKNIQEQVQYVSNGGVVSTLTQKDIGDFKITIMNSLEQQKITNFLDIKTAKFDSIISKKELLIEKLEEAKKSLISEVVTGKVKIVDGKLLERKPHEMKDSGVQWLGMIPKDWEIKRLKYLVELRNGKQKADINSKYIGLENIESNTGKYIKSKDEDGSIEGISNIFELNDVLFGKLRPYLAKCIVASFSGFCSSEILVFKSTQLENKLLKYNLLSYKFIDLVNSSTFGARMPRASWDFVGSIFMPYMDKQSQEEIVYVLDGIDLSINSTISKTKLQIQKLKQAKQSLISEAVTGKIDLRDWEIQEI